jgi:hypothetical protein
MEGNKWEVKERKGVERKKAEEKVNSTFSSVWIVSTFACSSKSSLT